METAYCIPLQFGNSVAYAYYTGTHLTQPQEICHTGHETLVKSGHELQYAFISQSCAFK